MKKQMRKIIFLFLVLSLLMLLPACQEETPPDIAVVGVSLDKSTVNLKVGESITLSATVSPADATNKAVSWESSDYFIAAVSQSGEVSALSAGRATVTVKTADGEKTAVCVVTVTEDSADENVPVSEVGISNPTLALNVGATFQLTASVLPQNATNKTVSWTSSNTAVATVSENGLVSALAVGEANITVISADGGKTISCTVTVKAPSVEPAPVAVESVSLSLSALSLNVGGAQQLIATVLPENASNKDVLWSSSNPAVATVHANGGVVTGVSAGTAVITATTVDGAKTAVCTVTVSEASQEPSSVAVESVSLSLTALSLNIGGTHQLVATVLPANASNKEVLWTSSNPAVATVHSGGGVVTGISAGTAVITATTVDGAKTASCTVTVAGGSAVPAPEYLGIYVSPSTPSPTVPRITGTAVETSANVISFLEMLYSGGSWTLSQNAPTASACDLYANPGDTVFVEVWLNNPSQCTILSLTLSGVKYQVGGALQSYFYQGGKNCVFVQIQIPAGTYVEKIFTVDQIQYVEESNAISGNGKDVMLGEKDKTVSIGLPYQTHPTVAYDSQNAVIAYDSITLPYSITDACAVIPHAGAWVRACLVSELGILDQKIAENQTSVSFEGLSSSCDYAIMFIGYYDLRDGNGPVVVELARYEFKTDNYLKISGTGDYHTYDYVEGGIAKQKKGAEITVNINPQGGKSATKLEIATFDNIGIPTVRYTANASEIEALNTNKTVTIASESLYNNTVHEIRVYYDAEIYETASVKTPRIIVPTFAGFEPMVDGKSIDYIFDGGILDGYGGYEEIIPEYAEYGSYVNNFWKGETEYDYTKAYVTSNAGFQEFLVVEHEAAAIINPSDLYIYASGMQSSIYQVEKARYEYNTDGRKLYYAGRQDNCKIGQNFVVGDPSLRMYEAQEVEKSVKRYVLVDNNYIEYEDFDKRYYPIHYVEAYFDLNDGKEPVHFRVSIGLDVPEIDWNLGSLITSDEYKIYPQEAVDSFLYVPESNPDEGESLSFYTVVNGTEITLRYNPLSFPNKLYINPTGIALSDGSYMQPQFLSTGGYEHTVLNIPTGNQIVLTHYCSKDGGSHVSFESLASDPALANLTERGFTSYGISTSRELYFTACKYVMSKEPVFEFSPSEISELEAHKAITEAAWLEDYMSQILDGDGAALEFVPAPEFAPWREVKFNIDTDKYPLGNYNLVCIDPLESMYFSYEQIAYFKNYSPYDTSIDFAFIAPLQSAGDFSIKSTTPVTVPTNIRMEDGVIKWDGTTDATRVRVSIIYERGGEQRKTAESLAYTEWTDTIDGAIHSLIVENQVTEADVTVELEFILEMDGEIVLRAPAKGNSFSYTRKPSKDAPVVEYICDYHENIVGEEWNSMMPNIVNSGLVYAKITSPISDNLRYSVNGGEWTNCFATVEGTTYIGYMDGTVARPLAIKYGDRIEAYYAENGYDTSDSERYDKTVKLVENCEAALTPGDGTIHIGIGDYLTVPVLTNYKLYPFRLYIEYRIDGGEITRVWEEHFYDRNIPVAAGSTLEVRLCIEPGVPDNPLSTRFLPAPIVCEWASCTMPAG